MAQSPAATRADPGNRVIDSTARSWWTSLDRQLNSPGGRRALLALFLFVAFVFSILPVLRCWRGQSVIDYRTWYETGRHVLDGAEIYFPRKTEFDFIYPPTCALLFAVASILGQCGLIVILVVINSIAWFVGARLAATLAAGEAKPNTWLYVAPSFLVMVSIWSNYHLGQPSIVLLALILCAFWLLRAKQEALAGVLIAFAAAIKAFPVMLLVYLVYRKYWKAAASLVLTLVFFLLVLPAPFRGGFERSWHDFQKWSAGMLKYNDRGIGQRPGRSQTWKNQSIVGTANRLLRQVDIDDTTPPDQPTYVNLAQLSFAAVNAIIIAIALAIGIVFLVVLPPASLRTAQNDALEFALLLLMILMMTPLSYSYLYVWLVLPFAVITQRLLAGHRTILWWGIAAYLVFFLALPFGRFAQAYGNFLAGALILFIGLSLELWRARGTAISQSPID